MPPTKRTLVLLGVVLFAMLISIFTFSRWEKNTNEETAQQETIENPFEQKDASPLQLLGAPEGLGTPSFFRTLVAIFMGTYHSPQSPYKAIVSPCTNRAETRTSLYLLVCTLRT